MLRKDMTKVEIEKELKGKGDYVLIDNITRFLKENLPIDIKKFVYLKLVNVYEKRNMFADAANVYNRLIEISLVPHDKIDYATKEIECYIKAGFFDKADLAIRKNIGELKEMDRRKMINLIIEFYKKQAQVYEKEKRRSMALRTYEKLLTMNLSDIEKSEINKKLLELYNNLGMIEQYMILKKRLGNI